MITSTPINTDSLPESNWETTRVRAVILQFPVCTERKAVVIDATVRRHKDYNASMSDTNVLLSCVRKGISMWMRLSDSDATECTTPNMTWFLKELCGARRCFSDSMPVSSLTLLQQCILAAGVIDFELVECNSTDISHNWDWNDWLCDPPAKAAKKVKDQPS